MKIEFKKIVDNFLLINLFLVIIFAIYFLFAVIMQINGVFVFLLYFQKFWNPLIVPLITILIISSLISGINSWLLNKLRSQGEDIEI